MGLNIGLREFGYLTFSAFEGYYSICVIQWASPVLLIFERSGRSNKEIGYYISSYKAKCQSEDGSSQQRKESATKLCLFTIDKLVNRNPNPDTILNNSSSSMSTFYSESVLLVPNPISIEKLGSNFEPLPPNRPESNFKIGSDFSFFLKQAYYSTYNSTYTLKCQKEF